MPIVVRFAKPLVSVRFFTADDSEGDNAAFGDGDASIMPKELTDGKDYRCMVQILLSYLRDVQPAKYTNYPLHICNFPPLDLVMSLLIDYLVNTCLWCVRRFLLISSI